jgi:tRNA (cmo5U34)-methyltransferase
MNSINKFSFETIKDFDDHIAKSIPNYDLLADAIRTIVPYFLQDDGAVIDLGCSTGALLESIKFDGFKLGIDSSKNLLPESHDLTQYFLGDINVAELPPSCVVLSIFTLQFIDRKNRLNILESIYKSLNDGGVFIWAEKVYAETGFWENILTSSHFDFKRKSFSTEEILNKDQDLRDEMRPNSTDQNMYLANMVGFYDFQLLWKFYNFECYLMVK